MKFDNETRWWNIFLPERNSQADDTCPAVPVNDGRNWQKSLANLYCPCRADSTAYECQVVLT